LGNEAFRRSREIEPYVAATQAATALEGFLGLVALRNQ